MTIQEALTAYRTYAKAEGKSPKTISWVVSSMTYFADQGLMSVHVKNQDLYSTTAQSVFCLKDKTFISKISLVFSQKV